MLSTGLPLTESQPGPGDTGNNGWLPNVVSVIIEPEGHGTPEKKERILCRAAEGRKGFVSWVTRSV